jgi:hypothetical protein
LFDIVTDEDNDLATEGNNMGTDAKYVHTKLYQKTGNTLLDFMKPFSLQAGIA